MRAAQDALPHGLFRCAVGGSAQIFHEHSGRGVIGQAGVRQKNSRLHAVKDLNLLRARRLPGRSAGAAVPSQQGVKAFAAGEQSGHNWGVSGIGSVREERQPAAPGSGGRCAALNGDGECPLYLKRAIGGGNSYLLSGREMETCVTRSDMLHGSISGRYLSQCLGGREDDFVILVDRLAKG